MLDDILQQFYDEEVQSVEMKKVAAALDECSDEELVSLKVAVDGEEEPLKKEALGTLGALVGLPFAGAATGAGMYALKGLGRQGVAPLAQRAAMGAGAGGTIGLAMSGLVGIGKLLEKADPSGKTLETAMHLAPAMMASGAVGSDIRKISNVKQLATPARRLAKRLKRSELGQAAVRAAGTTRRQAKAGVPLAAVAGGVTRLSKGPLTAPQALKGAARGALGGTAAMFGTAMGSEVRGRSGAIKEELKTLAGTASEEGKKRLRGILLGGAHRKRQG